jgi:septal ring factor EnvC (AmiA/AmiB activator)
VLRIQRGLNRRICRNFSGPSFHLLIKLPRGPSKVLDRRRKRLLAMSFTASINSRAVRESIRTWTAERESLDVQLSDSIAALSAYQSHLDAWQQQLAAERNTLREEREQFEKQRASKEKDSSESVGALTNELNAAREKITALTTLLLNRTEELRSLDNRRAEVQTELELSRSRERELKAALDDTKRAADQERSQWAEELHQLRDVVERQMDTPAVEQSESANTPIPTTAPETPVAVTTAPRAVSSSGARVIPRETPVFGSIVEQFGKLRQQRAVERQTHRPK